MLDMDEQWGVAEPPREGMESYVDAFGETRYEETAPLPPPSLRRMMGADLSRAAGDDALDRMNGTVARPSRRGDVPNPDVFDDDAPGRTTAALPRQVEAHATRRVALNRRGVQPAAQHERSLADRSDLYEGLNVKRCRVPKIFPMTRRGANGGHVLRRGAQGVRHRRRPARAGAGLGAPLRDDDRAVDGARSRARLHATTTAAPARGARARRRGRPRARRARRRARATTTFAKAAAGARARARPRRARRRLGRRGARASPASARRTRRRTRRGRSRATRRPRRATPCGLGARRRRPARSGRGRHGAVDVRLVRGGRAAAAHVRRARGARGGDRARRRRLGRVRGVSATTRVPGVLAAPLDADAADAPTRRADASAATRACRGDRGAADGLVRALGGPRARRRRRLVGGAARGGRLLRRAGARGRGG